MWLLPIILMMGLVPVLVHSYAYSTNLAQFDWFPNNAMIRRIYFCVEDDCNHNCRDYNDCCSVDSLFE